ncbi:MAG TPA: hypothetical protein VGR84_18810 [Candidatus Acidoferrales bacterium]|nr:hypothetical protein [Candidatus Acidoferrales bacterium]
MTDAPSCAGCVGLRERIAALEASSAEKDKAVDKAFGELSRWQISANEWRATLSDERNRMVARTELDAKLEVVNTAIRGISRLALAAVGTGLTVGFGILALALQHR